MSYFKLLFFFLCSTLGCFTSTFAEAKNMETQTAIFAMGCFWCGESEFTQNKRPLSGILSLEVGYTGGTSLHPTYQDHEGHQEAIKIVFNPQIISYDTLLDIFWHNIDPLDSAGQFCDRGPAYTATIFYSTEEQKTKASHTKQHWESVLNSPIATTIKAASTFYAAEDYHQNYALKNPMRYHYYRWNCGRDARLKELWGPRAHED